MADCCSYAMANQSLLQHQIAVAIFIISPSRVLNFSIWFALRCCCQCNCSCCYLVCCCCCYNSSRTRVCAALRGCCILWGDVRCMVAVRSVCLLVFLLIKSVCFCTLCFLCTFIYSHTFELVCASRLCIHFGAFRLRSARFVNWLQPIDCVEFRFISQNWMRCCLQLSSFAPFA